MRKPTALVGDRMEVRRLVGDPGEEARDIRVGGD
jgi:hypothetical protein